MRYLSTEFDMMKTHPSKKLKYISDIMHPFVVVPATLSKNYYLDLASPTNSNPTPSSHSSWSTGVKAEENCVKLVRNPKSLYILSNEYKFGIGDQ